MRLEQGEHAHFVGPTTRVDGRSCPISEYTLQGDKPHIVWKFFYNAAAASIAPAALKVFLLVKTTSTGYFHSINLAHPVHLSVFNQEQKAPPQPQQQTHPSKHISCQSTCPHTAPGPSSISVPVAAGSPSILSPRLILLYRRRRLCRRWERSREARRFRKVGMGRGRGRDWRWGIEGWRVMTLYRKYWGVEREREVAIKIKLLKALDKYFSQWRSSERSEVLAA